MVTIRAIVWTEYGSPAGLCLVDVPKPTPAVDELLIRIRATAVTAGDCELRALRFGIGMRVLVRLIMGPTRPRRKVLGQELAGNACVAFSMIGDLDRATRAHGDRGYRYVHFEAGAIGHRLYLAAEALGLGATGIGAFYDEEVHRYLNLKPEQGRVVYHFAIGYPVPDYRLGA